MSPKTGSLTGVRLPPRMEGMEAVNIREAKARLNALVEAAERGEQVVLMRGSKLVAAIVALSAEDVEIAPRLTDGQAQRFWRRLANERRDGSSVVFDSPADAVASLSTPRAVPRKRRASSRSTRGRSRRR